MFVYILLFASKLLLDVVMIVCHCYADIGVLYASLDRWFDAEMLLQSCWELRCGDNSDDNNSTGGTDSGGGGDSSFIVQSIKDMRRLAAHSAHRTTTDVALGHIPHGVGMADPQVSEMMNHDDVMIAIILMLIIIMMMIVIV